MGSLERSLLFEQDLREKEPIEFSRALESSQITERFDPKRKIPLDCTCVCVPDMVHKGYTSFMSSMFGARIMSIIPMI